MLRFRFLYDACNWKGITPDVTGRECDSEIYQDYDDSTFQKLIRNAAYRMRRERLDDSGGLEYFHDADSIRFLDEAGRESGTRYEYQKDAWLSIFRNGVRMPLSAVRQAIAYGLTLICHSKQGIYTGLASIRSNNQEQYDTAWFWRCLSGLEGDILVGISMDSFGLADLEADVSMDLFSFLEMIGAPYVMENVPAAWPFCAEGLYIDGSAPAMPKPAALLSRLGERITSSRSWLYHPDRMLSLLRELYPAERRLPDDVGLAFDTMCDWISENEEALLAICKEEDAYVDEEPSICSIGMELTALQIPDEVSVHFHLYKDRNPVFLISDYLQQAHIFFFIRRQDGTYSMEERSTLLTVEGEEIWPYDYPTVLQCLLGRAAEGASDMGQLILICYTDAPMILPEELAECLFWGFEITGGRVDCCDKVESLYRLGKWLEEITGALIRSDGE